MSLVNDLLIEAERRRERGQRSRGARLDDLVPTRRPDAPGIRARERRSRSRLLLGSMALAISIVVASALTPRGILDQRIAWIRNDARGGVSALPPAVSARADRLEIPAKVPTAAESRPHEPSSPPDEIAPAAAPPAPEPAEALATGPEAESDHEPDPELELEPESEAEPEFEIDEPASTSAPRRIEPVLGDPLALRIERSQRDQERESIARLQRERRALLQAARAARSGGRPEEAEAAYRQLASHSPTDPSALVEWSDLLAERDRAEEAIGLIASAREHAPRDQKLLMAHARLLADRGDPANAIALIDESGLEPTEAPDVHALAAAYHQRAGQHALAIDRYEHVLRRFPGEARGWLGLGISLEAVGRSREARDVYRIALSVGELPIDARSWVTGRLSKIDEER